MSFTFTANPVVDPKQFDRDNGPAIVTKIGYDDERGLTYSLVVGFGVAPPGEYEYYFHIVVLDEGTDEVTEIWNGEDSKSFLKRADRGVVLDLIVESTKLLIDRLRPDRFVMVTHDARLPERAMVKYHILLGYFKGWGYKVTAADPYHGIHSWWMESEENSVVESD